MIQQKKKQCSSCGVDCFVWKSSGGKKLCKKCAIGKVVIKPTKKAKPIAPRSVKRAKEEKIYLGKRLIYLKEHPRCEARIQGICLGQADQIHHKKGRIGDDLIDETNFLACCGPCHNYIENNREFAMEQGFSIKRIN
jgi:hypothetical protein